MPKLGSRVKWNGDYYFGSVAMLAKPDHASMVASVIAGWSAIEAHLGRVFATLVSSTHPVTMSMYGAARSFEVQRDLLVAAAKKTLAETYFLTFKDAITVVSKASSDRNKFAHGVWGHSADPDLNALLLVDSEHLWDVTRRRMKHRRSIGWKPGTNPPAEFLLNMPFLERDKIMIYEMSDLTDANQRIERAYQLADALLDLSIAATGPERRRILRWLRSQPEIQKVEAKRKKNPQSEPPSRSHRDRS